MISERGNKNIMGKLVSSFRQKMGNDPQMREAVYDVAYPTGFLALDFLNGSIVKVQNKSNYYSVGLIDGTCITIIGRSGCGKTTLAVQAAANIIRPFEDGVMFYDDIEGGSNANRRLVLSKFKQDEVIDRIVYRNAGITAENFFERISQIHSLKTENYKDFEYDTGLLDPQGNRIMKLIPTVYILDSLAMLAPGKITEEEQLSGQMSATAMAKTNTQVYKRMIPKLKAANIILLVINHINDKVDINAFSKTKAQVGWLKTDETLPGGKAAIYLSNNMLRLDDNTKLKETEGLGIFGNIVDVSLVKSRTNASGRSIPLVFNSMEGFDPELSLLIFLKSIGEITAKGAYMSMLDYPDMKFTQKGFKDKLAKDPEFAKAFNASCLKKLKELIREDIEEEMVTLDEEVQKTINSTLAILEQMNTGLMIA